MNIPNDEIITLCLGEKLTLNTIFANSLSTGSTDKILEIKIADKKPRSYAL